MHILRANFNGSPNVGLHGYATENELLLGESLQEKLLKDVSSALGDIPIHTVKIAGTSMPGVFLVGNSNAVLAPGIIFENEKKIIEQLKIPLKIFHTQQTCLANNIACNDHGAIISTAFDETERKKIEELLGVPTVQADIAGLSTPGALIVTNENRGIIHRDATEEEAALVEKTLKVTLEPATTNMGTPYLNAAIIHNKHGFIIGDASGGPEIVHIDDALYGEEE